MTTAYEAMLFARQVHATQVRKYTGNPYTDHLAEVAGIVATLDAHAGRGWPSGPDISMSGMVAVAWLHDSMEDQGVTYETLASMFGDLVANGVRLLSDLETGNRAERKAASRLRLADAPPWVQTIKCADLLSNTSSIVKHDPKFAEVYLAEKRLLLDVLTKADPRLRDLARQQAAASHT